MREASVVLLSPLDNAAIQELKDHVPVILDQFFGMVTELPTNEVLEVLNNTIDAFLEVVWPYATKVSERLVRRLCYSR